VSKNLPDKMPIASPLAPATTTTVSMAERCCEIMLEIQRRADEHKLADTAGRSMDSYHHDVAQFVTFIRERDLSIVEGLDEWIRHVKTTCRARTVNRKLAAVRARILGSRTAAGVVDVLERELDAPMRARIESSLRKIKGMKVNSNAVRSSRIVNYQVELPALLEGITEPAVRLVVEFMAHTGTRITEALTAELRNCEREGRYMRITITGKGSKERAVWIPGELYERILVECKPERYLFEHNWHGERRPYNSRSMTTRIGTWTERILGRRLPAHSFRHSAITYLIRDKGLDIKQVSVYAGHSSTAITADIYDHVMTTPEDVAVVIG